MKQNKITVKSHICKYYSDSHYYAIRIIFLCTRFLAGIIHVPKERTAKRTEKFQVIRLFKLLQHLSFDTV